MSNLSDTSLELIKRLEKIWDDPEFVIGIMSNAQTEEARSELLKFIKNGKNVDIESVTVFAIRLGNRHK